MCNPGKTQKNVGVIVSEGMKKVITMLLFLLIVVVALVACADDKPEGQDPDRNGESSDKIILTFGGVWITHSPTIQSAVRAFNYENDEYEIQIVDYIDSGDDDLGGALLRFQIELMTGGGPDIIFDNFRRLFDHGPFLDLYPFIDADPELSREDFFPNMLQGMERADGTLPMFTNSFQSINTMIGVNENVAHSDKWTPAELIKVAEKNSEMPYPFGLYWTSSTFMTEMLRFNSAQFINTNTFEAHIDSDDFISLLQVAKCFPDLNGYESALNTYGNDYIRMLHGNQQLSVVSIHRFMDYHLLTEIFGESLVIMGMPTGEGGMCFLNVQSMMGINAATKHPDKVWEFLRNFLLPTATIDSFRQGSIDYFQQIPLRIDIYEAFIEHLMTPRYRTDTEGVTLETPYVIFELTDSGGIVEISSVEHAQGAVYELYAMPEDVAKNLRIIVESAKVARSFFTAELNLIIYADLNLYFSGARTAQETARIMQGRVELYLSELQLSR